MIIEELYKKTICSNCANENCNKIELMGAKIDETIVTKCKNFICKHKREDRRFRGGY